MASIFTFETERPRVLSPWPQGPPTEANDVSEQGKYTLAGLPKPREENVVNVGIGKLEPEPQEGPTEYKLHLLLRPRRNLVSTSTVQSVSGSHLSASRALSAPSISNGTQTKATPSLASSSQSRQNRLQNLTTQLLWRLQQSSHYHSSSNSSLVLPVLPEANVELFASNGPGPLLPGLEESSGALYEIGVSDDGTFVGLAEDELEESLIVLRAMASSLGCRVQIVRMIIVGDCQWSEIAGPKTKPVTRLHKERLLVAEVLVIPATGRSNTSSPATVSGSRDILQGRSPHDETGKDTNNGSRSEQLRVSLTGSTTSGKSSLLGTLTTSTLDNGRGKSRLSLLKHRHEIVSGVTSSLAQELFGYQEVASSNNGCNTKVINYASGNVSSWEDIHNASDPGRLIFVTDSAGHPRYKRTTVRGLVSWAPHWTLCCLAADDQEDNTGKVGATASARDILGSAGLGMDLSKAHLDLCLKLNLPLVIVVTKLDLATKTGLRETLAKALTTVKSAGRKPVVLSTASDASVDSQLHAIASVDEEVVRRAVTSVPPDELHLLVPIVLTSAVTGNGIGKLHALLRQLPIFATNDVVKSTLPSTGIPKPSNLFHVDEVFTIPSSQSTSSKSKISTPSSILSGYLKYGSINVGDLVSIGPCIADDIEPPRESLDLQRARSYPGLLKTSFTPDKPALVFQRPASRETLEILEGRRIIPRSPQIWQEVRVTSLRNLRLPVRSLFADQVGTIGITLNDTISTGQSTSMTSDTYIRRGMVVLSTHTGFSGESNPSYNRFTAIFQQAGLPAWPGVLVTVYIASIRASAKIIEVRAVESEPAADEVFHFDENEGDQDGTAISEILMSSQQTEITFEFATTREWLEVGTQVLVTPGGGPSLTGQPEQKEVGSAGLDGYVGKITLATVC